MGGQESVLFVPLRSNAYQLLAGAPVEAVRRRLKYASLVFDRILLESGVVHVNAGPRASSSLISRVSGIDGFQTPRQRQLRQGQPFIVSIGEQQAPGAPAESLRTVGESATAIAWAATLKPFARELPAGCNWIDFLTPPKLNGVKEQARVWSRTDEANQVLRDAIPIPFARKAVIENANTDLAWAAHSGMATTLDSLHQQVVARRLLDTEGWRSRGSVVRLHFPAVAHQDWSTIVELRSDRNMSRFREVIQQAEAEALQEAQSGDVDAAAHHIYDRYVADVAGLVDKLGPSRQRRVAMLVIGVTAGLATTGLTPPLGPVVGAGVSEVVNTGLDEMTSIQLRKRYGWVSVHQALKRLEPA